MTAADDKVVGPAGTAAEGPHAPDPGAAPDSGRSTPDPLTAGVRRRAMPALRDLGAGLVGALPVLWVLGAVPWRFPSLLIEDMFRGFTGCAMESGALSPVLMLCERAGVPLGMYQLDGGLSYPLGGVFLRLGVEPLAAWKSSVSLLVVSGFVAMFWLGRRLTGSVPIAAVLVVVLGLGGTMSARSWSWYWNVVAVALLPTLFASVFVLYDRARARRLGPLLVPAVAVLACTLVIGIEWTYAGLFATAVAVGAAGLLAVQRRWTWPQRTLLVAGGAGGAAVIFVMQRVRLNTAGIGDQSRHAYDNAAAHSVDLVSLVAPDGHASLIGRVLALVGREGMLVRSLSEGEHLWAAPYLGVLTIALFAAVFARRRGRLEYNPRCPPGYLPLLVAVALASIVLSIGPVVHAAKLAAPEASFTSPLSFLWTSTVVQWIRYPWTWTFLTYVSLLLTFAALTPALLRRHRSWSPLVWVLAGLVVLEFASPAVLAASVSPNPGPPTAPPENRVSSRQPAVARFEAEAIPELQRALGEVDGIATLLPWRNAWITPRLIGGSDARVRNVGIDRNLRQVDRAAPIPREELRRPTADTVRRMLGRGWTDAVVLLDYYPSAEAIVRHDHQHLNPRGHGWSRRVHRIVRQLVGAGHCVEAHSWFTVITLCADGRPSERLP